MEVVRGKLRTLRMWRRIDDELHGIVVPVCWDQPVMHAECCPNIRYFPERHSAPHDHCSCGIYGLKAKYTENPGEILGMVPARYPAKDLSQWTQIMRVVGYAVIGLNSSAFYLESDIVGYVDLWGQTIEFELGYRAEYAQVITLFIHSHVPPEIRQGLIRRYECNLVEYPKPRGKA